MTARIFIDGEAIRCVIPWSANTELHLTEAGEARETATGSFSANIRAELTSFLHNRDQRHSRCLVALGV